MKRLILALVRFLLRFCPGWHLHRDPRKGIKVSPLTADELQNLLKEDESHAALPRHTPEELDRLIGTVRKAESPEEDEGKIK